MAQIGCPNEDELSKFAAGVATGGAHALAAHLDVCDRCQRTMEDLAGASSYLPAESSKRRAQLQFRDEPGFRQIEHNLLSLNSKASAGGIPKHLGEYEMLEQIGRGGMGEVYVARHTGLNRLFAVKVLSRDRLSDTSTVARFRLEMATAGKLKHPNIVHGHDGGQADGVHYLVMELLEGVTLADLSKAKSQLPVAEACELVRQACLGLHHAHEAGMIHRDVKPSNLMLCGTADQTPIVKVLDLGLARFNNHNQPITSLTATGQMMGTLEFMAPEQGLKDTELDRRADVYSTGATLYKLLTGRSPFDSADYESPLKMMHALATEKHASITDHRELPEELSALVDQMLSREPNSRPATLLEVSRRLELFTQGCDLSGLLEEEHLPKLRSETEVPHGTVEELRVPATPNVRTQNGTGGVRGIAFIGLAGLILALSVILFLRTKHGIVRVEIVDPEIEVTLDGDERLRVKDGRSEFEVVPGAHRLRVKVGATEFLTSEFEINRGETTALRVAMLDNSVRISDSGQTLDEHQLPLKPEAAAGTTEFVRYGDRVNIVGMNDAFLSAQTGVWTDHNFNQLMRSVMSHRADDSLSRAQAARELVWQIRRDLQADGEPGIVRYGDSVFLKANVISPQLWMTGNRKRESRTLRTGSTALPASSRFGGQGQYQKRSLSQCRGPPDVRQPETDSTQSKRRVS